MLDKAMLCGVGGHLDNWLFWTIVNSADMSICIHGSTFFGVHFCLVYVPSSGIARP